MPTSQKKKPMKRFSPLNFHWPSLSPSPSPPPSSPSPPLFTVAIQALSVANGTEKNYHQTHTSYFHHHRPRPRPLWHLRPHHQNSYPPSLPSPLCQPMDVGDEFVDFKAFKAAMADWSLTGAHKYTFRYQNSSKARSIVVYAHAGCFFRVYAAMDKDRQYIRFQVSLYLLRSCSDTTSGRLL